MKKQSMRSALLALAALIAASLACNLPGVSSSQTPAATPIPVSTEAVLQLEQEVQQAVATAQTGGTTTIRMTEEQLTSLVALEMQGSSEPMLANPQVLLRDGQAQLLGDVQQGGVELPVKIVAEISVDANGQPQTRVVSGNIGPLPMPQSLLDQVQAQMDTILDQQLAAQGNMIIESIVIANGEMTITGRTQP